MGVDLQRASLWKRMAAWLLDIILLCVLAVGAAAALSALLRYDAANQALQEQYDRYGSQYGVTFEISQEEYLALSQEDKAGYDAAYEALVADENVLFLYNKVINLTLLMTTFGILIAMLILEFVVPLFLKNGQTLGKKCFGIGLVRSDGVRLNTLQLFVRTLLGKYTIGTMIPVYILLLIFWGSMDVTGTLILLGLLVGQLVCVCVTRNHSAIQDLLAGTVAVDIASQQIFKTTDELIAYTKRIHAERAQRQEY